jgi:hypothetical protein
MSPILGILASSIPSRGDYESIATVTVGAGGTSSISFSSIASTYKHLQIRYLWNGSGGSGDNNIALRCNGDTGSNYTLHQLRGDGSSASAAGATGIGFARIGYYADITSYASVGIVDILDYTSTNKQKTIRSLNGYDSNGSGKVGLNSSAWLPGTIAAISSLTILSGNSITIPEYSSFALYGIK